MSKSHQSLWSDNPHSAKNPYVTHGGERAIFAGTLVGSILYGVVVMLFFKCIMALFNPAYRRGDPIKWGVVSYTVVIFSFVTVLTAANLYILSISYIDNREFPGAHGVVSPGPYGYQCFISPEALAIIPNVMFTLSNWLADGLLLYRCYVIYSANSWAIALPCLMYLSSIALGVVVVYQNAQVSGSVWSILPYFSISLSLNVLLTLMIVIRLILYTKTDRTAVGVTRLGGLIRAIVAMLIESCAVYAISSLLYIGLWSAGNSATAALLPIISETQVIAPLLIIQRVADKSVLTSNAFISGHISSFKARNRWGSRGGSVIPPDGNLTSSISQCGTNS